MDGENLNMLEISFEQKIKNNNGYKTIYFNHQLYECVTVFEKNEKLATDF